MDQNQQIQKALLAWMESQDVDTSHAVAAMLSIIGASIGNHGSTPKEIAGLVSDAHKVLLEAALVHWAEKRKTD